MIIDSGIAISSDVIRVCAEEAISIHFISSRCCGYAILYPAGLTGTVLARRAQLLAYKSTTGAALAKAFMQGKLENQTNLLCSIAKYHQETEPA